MVIRKISHLDQDAFFASVEQQGAVYAASIGAERSFTEDLRNRQEMLDVIARILLRRLAEVNVHSRTLTLKVKFVR